VKASRIVAAAVAGAAVIAGSSVLALHTGGEGFGRSWPSSIAPLAHFVEDEHDTDIDPVPVRFLDDAAFERTFASEDQLDAEGRHQAEDLTSELRALGLVGADFDLVKTESDLHTGGTAAYYDPARREVVVRGRTISISIKSTLVHELTHVAQDAAGSLDTEHDDDPRSLMALAIVEGDAERTRQAWVGALSRRDLATLQKEVTSASDEAEKAIGEVPPVLTTQFEAPYSLGQAFTRAVAAERGNKAVLRLTKTTPPDDLGLLDPVGYLDGRRGRSVARPKPGAGRVLDRSRMGAVTLFAVLAQRIEPAMALDAADGWGGDAYVSWRSGGRTCSRTAFRGQTAGDTSVLNDALRRWTAAGPAASDATVSTGTGTGTVTLTSCEPRGPAAKLAPVTAATAADALLLPTVRASVQAELLEAGFDHPVARCTADALVKAVSFETLRDDQGALQAVAPRALAGCRAGPQAP
jgi:hypothetical protein